MVAPPSNPTPLEPANFVASFRNDRCDWVRFQAAPGTRIDTENALYVSRMMLGASLERVSMIVAAMSDG